VTDTERSAVVALLKAAASIVDVETIWLEPPVLMGFTLDELIKLRSFIDAHTTTRNVTGLLALAQVGLDAVRDRDKP